MEVWAWVLCLQGLSLAGILCIRVIVERIWRPWRLIMLLQKQGMKGFPFVPLVGQLPQVYKALNDNDKGSGLDWKAFSTAKNCVETYGRVFYFTTGRTVRICIAEPDLVKIILQTNADSYSKPSFIHVLEILKTGLFASSGEEWAPQRQLLGLEFTTKHIKTEVGVIASCARAALKRWSREIDSGSGELPIYNKLSELTLDVIKGLGFSVETMDSDKPSSSVALSFNRYLDNCRGLVFGPAAAVPGYRYMPTQLNKEILKDQTWLTGVIEQMIIARSSEYVASTPSEERENKDILDVLLTAAEINSQQLRDNGLTFLLAGHHTTASLLTWTMYLLALHPLWQERARAEVEEFCSDGALQWNTLSHFKTITMILYETLRLFPPIPVIGRLCEKENTVGPYIIPQGVEILIPTAVIHRDKELWGEDADQFQPMRFANGLGRASKHNLGYFPFGSGPRTCVGQNLALAEARAVLGVILPAFSWKLGPAYYHCPDVSLTLHPKFDIPIIMEKLS